MGESIAKVWDEKEENQQPDPKKELYRTHMRLSLGATQAEAVLWSQIRTLLEQGSRPIRESPVESASSPLVGFGWLNDNVIKGLTRLLSVDRW